MPHTETADKVRVPVQSQRRYYLESNKADKAAGMVNGAPASKLYVFNQNQTPAKTVNKQQDVHKKTNRPPAQAAAKRGTGKTTGKNKIHPIKKLNRRFRKNGLTAVDSYFNARFFYYIWKMEKSSVRGNDKKYGAYINIMTAIAKIYGITAELFLPLFSLLNAVKPEPASKNGGLLKRVFSSAAPVCVMAFTAFIIINVAGYSPRFELWVDGERIGIVASRETVTRTSRRSELNISAIMGEQHEFSGIINYRVVFARNPDYLTEHEISEVIRRYSRIYIMSAYGLYIDDELVGATTDENYIEETLNWILTEITGRGSDEVEAVGFANDLRIVKRDFARRDVLTGEEFRNIVGYSAIAAFNDNNDNGGAYDSQAEITAVAAFLADAFQDAESMTAELTTIESGPDIAVVAAAVNLSNEAVNTLPRGGINLLAAANNNSIIARVSRSSASAAGIQFVKTHTETYIVDVPFETQYIESDQHFVGTETVRTSGSNGKSRVTAEISFIGDTEISREIINVEVITPAVTRVVLTGTRARPSTSPTGTFIRPLSGTISQHFSAAHRGIDIPAPHGTRVLASDGGTVTFAGWGSSYGNYIMIRHANGYSTLYAHLSSMSVRNGDRVFQGQEIGRVGSTGRSTGNHLHFEIIRNGVRVNPLNYIPR